MSLLEVLVERAPAPSASSSSGVTQRDARRAELRAQALVPDAVLLVDELVGALA